MRIWQVSCKQEQGSPMELREFSSLWRALLWVARKLHESSRIIVIVKLDE